MDFKIKLFYLFNLLGRFSGLLLDVFIVYIATNAFAEVFYTIHAMPLLIFSLIGYLSSVMMQSEIQRRIKFNRMALLFPVFLFTCIGFSLILELDLSIIVLVFLAFSSLVSALIVFNKSLYLTNNIWLHPLSGIIASVIGIFAIFLFDKINLAIDVYILIVVVIMVMIRPVLFSLWSRDVERDRNENITEYTAKLIIILIILLGLRHAVLVYGRFFVPEEFLIEFSFNSKIVQSIFALSIIPLIRHSFNNAKICNAKLFYYQILIVLSLIMTNIFDLDIIFSRVHLSFILLIALLGVAIYQVDFQSLSLNRKILSMLFLLINSFLLLLVILLYWQYSINTLLVALIIVIYNQFILYIYRASYA